MVISISFYGTKSGVGALISGGNSTAWGPDGTAISDNNHFALALLVTIPLINYIRLNSALRAIQIGAAAVMGLCLIAVLASYSRGALLGLIAIGGFLWLKSKAKILPAVAIVIVLFGATSLMPSRWLDRMNSIDQYSEDGSAQGRLTMWHAAVAIAAKRPLGAGFLGPYSQDVVDLYDPGTRARAVHSIYFEVIGEHGFAVFVLWMLVPLFAWRNGSWIIRHTRDRPDMKWAGDAARMLQVSLVGYLVGGAFLSLSYWDIYFTLVAILAAVRNIVASGVPAALPQPVGPDTPLFSRVAPRVGSATSRR
jgi:probable O-glycosylation ligase (exosortase A-associated)